MTVNAAGEWLKDRNGVSRPLLTYNGANYDEIHLRNWDTMSDTMEGVFQRHVDVSKAADGVLKDSKYESLEDVCRKAGIEVQETYYEDYDLPDEVLERKPDDEETVSGEHLGEFLGEIELRELESIYEGESTDEPPPEALSEEHRELRMMIRDYAEADIKPLFQLYDEIQ